jgi:hypothetical protein
MNTKTAMRRRKLRVIIISMGGERQEILQRQFAKISEDFETPVFSPGVPSRSLRNRESFFRICHAAGLLPDAEWTALERAFDEESSPTNNNLFDCLKDVPITSVGRRGSDSDRAVHYSVELWRKAKTLNRGRAVLGCALAHLTALKRLTSSDEHFDILLEDNVRMPLDTLAESMWRILDATLDGSSCHMRYFGWLGSMPNLEWIYTRYMRDQAISVAIPLQQDIETDLAGATDNGSELINTNCRGEKDMSKPGGTNPVWGTYAYWISKDAYDSVMGLLRNDVGALMWKSKRMRYYHVKPIDKILPRQIRTAFGKESVQISRHPSFFRAPMLTSKIHTQWDPEFCKSTEYQLEQVGLSWSVLDLSAVEQIIVRHHKETGEWITPLKLEEKYKRGNLF